MPPTWEQLVGEGWKQRSTKRRSYVSPDGKVINSRRDITGPSRDDIGDILFPGRGLKVDPEIPGPSNKLDSLPVTHKDSTVTEMDLATTELSKSPVKRLSNSEVIPHMYIN